MTKYLQPLHISFNKPFTNYIAQEYDDWLACDNLLALAKIG